MLLVLCRFCGGIRRWSSCLRLDSPVCDRGGHKHAEQGRAHHHQPQAQLPGWKHPTQSLDRHFGPLRRHLFQYSLLRYWTSRVEELTNFPTDSYHEVVGPDLSCHELVESDFKNPELVGSDRSWLFRSEIFCAYFVLPEERVCPKSTFFGQQKS